jgi:hypothetical protein
LASVDGIDLRMPYQSDPVSRAKINAGRMDYLDVHLSSSSMVSYNLFFSMTLVVKRAHSVPGMLQTFHSSSDCVRAAQCGDGPVALVSSPASTAPDAACSACAELKNIDSRPHHLTRWR